MIETRTRALVLRTYDHGESDRLVHLYTESFGRVAAIAKGARRSRLRVPGTLEILTVLDTRIVDPPRSQLMRLEGARVASPFEGLVNDLGRFAIGCQLLELLNRFTGEREASPELFRFAVGVLGVLSHEVPDRLLALLVLTKTLARLGYRPQLARCAGCGLEIGSGRAGFQPREGGAVCDDCRDPADETVHPRILLALEAGIRAPLCDRGQLALSGPDLCRACVLLERFFRFHIGLELKTEAFLGAVLPIDRLDGRARRADTAPTSEPRTGSDGCSGWPAGDAVE